METQVAQLAQLAKLTQLAQLVQLEQSMGAVIAVAQAAPRQGVIYLCGPTAPTPGWTHQAPDSTSLRVVSPSTPTT